MDLTATNENKYAIYAYTHGPVTGSGPCVVNWMHSTAYVTLWLPIGWAKGPFLPPPPLFSQCEAHGRLSALAMRKIFEIFLLIAPPEKLAFKTAIKKCFQKLPLELVPKKWLPKWPPKMAPQKGPPKDYIPQ